MILHFERKAKSKAARLPLFGATLMTSLVVWAANTWPFMMSAVASYAGLTHEADRDLNFTAASNLPRLIMNNSVSQIKKGDIIRIIYSDGRVFDFEAARACSPMVSRPCEYSKVTQVPGADAPATPSQFRTDLARDKASCTGGVAGTQGSASIPVQLWRTTHDWNEAAQVFTTTGSMSLTWLTVTFLIPGNPSCH
jgi:hypothetical protein